jgi:hypothetical protein
VAAQHEGAEATQESDQESRQGRNQCGSQARSF